jgi:hypothetical protein
MPLVTNSDGKQLYAIYRVSDGAIIARNKIHFSIDETVQPSDGTLYLKMDTDVVPDYDSRIYDLVKTEEKIDLVWKATWATPKRPITDIKVAVTNRENIELERHVKIQEFKKLVMFAIGVLYQLQSGNTLTPRQTFIRNKFLAALTKINQNDDRATALFTAIDANQVPDIDAGWAAE